jgi:hypothetical protein
MICAIEEFREVERICRMEIRDGGQRGFVAPLDARAPLGSRALGWWNAEVPGGCLASNRRPAKEMSHPLIRRMARVVKSAKAEFTVDRLHFGNTQVELRIE